MNHRYRSPLFLLSLILFFSFQAKPQSTGDNDSQIEIKDFAAMHKFLASDWMEGREAGEKGSFMAADYIASMMEVFGLEPLGDAREKTDFNNQEKSYFQSFEIIKYQTEAASLSIINEGKDSKIIRHFSWHIDFDVESAYPSTEAESKTVFAGYGISDPENGYDDYQKIDARNCVVIVMDGFPGHRNPKSSSWQNFMSKIGEEKAWEETKLQTAMAHGAIGLIVLNAYEPIEYSVGNAQFLKMSMNANKLEDAEYEDSNFTLPHQQENNHIPVFKVSKETTEILLSSSNIQLKDIEKESEDRFVSFAQEIKDLKLAFSVQQKAEALLVRNVLGIIPGVDTTKNIIIGAHYDHLGIRDGMIYNGSDDNASGTAGVLSMAKLWAGKSEKPACNLIFAAWTAEEKGLWGSTYFADHFESTSDNTLLNINFDMISRSAPEDSSGLVISVGTMKKSEDLRKMTINNNMKLQRPLTLDIWDTATGGGSDYASFDHRDIPVLSFFSGYNLEYHTPRDIAYFADYGKMAAILNLSNNCLKDFLKKIKTK